MEQIALESDSRGSCKLLLGSQYSGQYLPKLFRIVFVIHGWIEFHIYYNKDRRVFIYFLLFGYENFRNFIFWPKLSPTCTESVVRGNLFEKQGFICYRPVNMIQQN